MSPSADLLEPLRRGEARALGRAISWMENGHPGARELMSRLWPHLGRAAVIGITGSPGAGKSTLTDQLARALRAEGQKVGILAVDPTSPFSGGAILGDRIRMGKCAADPGIFIRSMATRGALGGLARATQDAIDLLDAAGFDTVLVETVGVGQDEVDVVSCVQTCCVVLVPGMGDEIQAIKAGIMEVADLFVINKADRDGADQVEQGIEAMKSLSCVRPWDPRSCAPWPSRARASPNSWPRCVCTGCGSGPTAVWSARPGSGPGCASSPCWPKPPPGRPRSGLAWRGWRPPSRPSPTGRRIPTPPWRRF